MGNFIKRTRRNLGRGQSTTFTSNFNGGKTTRSSSTKNGNRTVTRSMSSDGSSRITEYITCGSTGAVKRTTKTYNTIKKNRGRKKSSSSRSASQNQGCAVFLPLLFLIGSIPYFFH